MRKWVRTVLTVFAAATVLILVVFALRPRQAPEPAYEGKDLSQWLLLLDSHADHQAENNAAAQAVASMGTNALPALIHILQKREHFPVVKRLEDWAVHFHLLHASKLPLEEWQYRAARACCILSEGNHFDITPAISELAYHFTNTLSDRLEPFAWGLVYSGPEGLSIVTNMMMRSPSITVREEAARSLWITPKVRIPEVANALVAGTRDPAVRVRVTAILSLQSFLRQKSLEPLIVAGVIPALEDTNSEVRKWTIELLSCSGPSLAVDSALSNHLSDSDPQIRAYAEQALRKRSIGTGQ